MGKLGIITIGQSPRIDLTEDLVNILNENITVIERGILDNYTYQEVIDNFKPSHGEKMLVSRMKDGREVKLSEKKITDCMQECIIDLEKDVDMILILCTGRFPKYNHNKPLLIPQEILHSIVSKLSNEKEIGVIIPKDEQIDSITNWWEESGIKIQVKTASPYKDIETIENVSKHFKNKDIEYIILDCMGYSQAMKEIVKTRSQKMVILPRTLIARIINELII
ncbi:AroM family protein [Tissierella creatinophila]|uniref:AroM protein n=1 Tax=Tissierella creatinophila DSM 6911 TaxID=1123403 RepID=A0A1U7M731_TISCR|nr:AroM family protein [Tissierella creatinophila]OLS03107.1 hypothetical protein TICRE_08040 [Tissierella creatinophila DSM 6911]